MLRASILQNPISNRWIPPRQNFPLPYHTLYVQLRYRQSWQLVDHGSERQLNLPVSSGVQNVVRHRTGTRHCLEGPWLDRAFCIARRVKCGAILPLRKPAEKLFPEKWFYVTSGTSTKSEQEIACLLSSNLHDCWLVDWHGRNFEGDVLCRSCYCALHRTTDV